MNPFYLFPSNAVLLGLAVGEFERLNELHESDTFESIVDRRIRPFVPDPHEIEVPVDVEPPGLIWHQLADGTERSLPDFGNLDFLPDAFGAEASDDLPSLPNAPLESLEQERAPEFIRRGKKVFRIQYVEGKRNLISLLAEYLRPDSEGPRTESDETAAVLRRWKILEDRPDPKSPPEISRLVGRLIDSNRLENEYTFGRLLGRTFGDCVAAEKRLVFIEESFDNVEDEYLSVKPDELGNEQDDVSIYDSWANLVRALGNDPIFRECFITPELLRMTGKAFSRGTYFGLTRSEDNSSSRLNETLCVRTTLCLILGHVLGWLYFRDLRAGKDDAARRIPRGLALPVTASEEMIEGQLLMVEETAFNEQHERHYLPETVIRQIGNAVEGMTKQLWPDEFAKLKEQDTARRTGLLPEVLRRKKTTGTPLEKRFASGAEPLYSLYRNASEHEPNTFQCNWHEAHYFYVGVRLLLDLKRRILEARETKNK